MPLYVNNTEVEKLYRNNSAVKKMYADNTLVYEAIKYISKPTISGSFTFDTAEHSCTLTGFDANTMTKSGTESATAAGTYTVTVTPKPGCAWALPDGTSDPISLTWTIAKRSLTIPSLSGATTLAFIEGTQRGVTVLNYDSTYETQSGTTVSALIGDYTVTWALKYPASTQWSDGTTANKSASWSIGWVNGTSHYLNDIYNNGWVKSEGIIVAITGLSFADNVITVTGTGTGAQIGINEKDPNYTLHAEVYAARSGAAIFTMDSASSSSGSSYGDGTTGKTSTNNAWVEIYGSRNIPGYSSVRSYFGLRVGQAVNGVNGSKVRRIWYT